MFLVICLIIFVVVLASVGRIGPFVWAGRPLGGSRPGQQAEEQTPPPEMILAQRLAEGDITPEEYLERLSVIQGA